MTLTNKTPSEFVIPASWGIQSSNFNFKKPWVKVSSGDKPSKIQNKNNLPEPSHSRREASSSGSKPSTSSPNLPTSHRTRSLSKQRQHGRKSRASSDPPKSLSRFNRNHYQAQKEHNSYDDLSGYYYRFKKSPRTPKSSPIQSLKGHGVKALGWGARKMKTIQKAVLKKLPIRNFKSK